MNFAPSYPETPLTLRTGSQAGQSFNLSGDTITIGRASDNAVVLTDPTVSRYHARIVRQGPDYFLEDLGSTSGTQMNRTQVQRSERLAPGSVIRLGDAELVFGAGGVAGTGAAQFFHQAGGGGATQHPGQAVAGGATQVLGRSKGTAWLLVQKGAQAGRSFVLQGDSNTIGRSSNSAIRLDDQSVSRDHALVCKVSGQYVVYDLGSSSGTRVGGQPLTGANIREGSRIVLGNCQLEFNMVEGGGPADSPDKTVQLRQERRGTLLVRSGPAAGQSFPLGDELVIGREPGPGGAVLNDPSVSRRHALVRQTPQGYAVYDLGSANGTMVDGVKLAGRTLRNGDSIEIGATVLTFGQA